MGLNFNLEDQLAFYGEYHNNKWNQLIHVLFVPLIWWSAVVFTCHSGPLVEAYPTLSSLLGTVGLEGLLPEFVAQNFVLNLGALALAFYCIYYLTLGDLFAAISFDVILVILFLSANAFYAHFGDKAFTYALALHILSWYMQIHPGHGVFEGRKPSLTDSFFQSLVLAPLFVWFEVLFALGYRREFRARLQTRIDEAVARFQKQKQSEDSQQSKKAA